MSTMQNENVKPLKYRGPQPAECHQSFSLAAVQAGGGRKGRVRKLIFFISTETYC